MTRAHPRKRSLGADIDSPMHTQAEQAQAAGGQQHAQAAARRRGARGPARSRAGVAAAVDGRVAAGG